MKAHVYYAIVSQESAESGDCSESGEIERGLPLRDAIKALFATRTNEVDGIESIEASCDPLPVSGWLAFSPAVTVYNNMEYRTGDYENRSLCPVGRISAYSWRRLVRLIRGY